MGIPAGVNRVSFHGTLGGGQEIWQYSLWVARDITTQADADDLASDAYTAWIGGNLKALTLASQDTMEGVSAYCYPAGGSSATFIGTAGTSSAGTTTVRNPMQVAFVVTLETATAGRHGKGRIYLPARITTLNTSSQVSTTDRDAILTQVAGLITSLNGSLPSSVVSVVSQTTTSLHAVTSVSADQRLDIQRRRANRQSVGARARQTV
jgi:hypothetical protein